MNSFFFSLCFYLYKYDELWSHSLDAGISATNGDTVPFSKVLKVFSESRESIDSSL